MKNFFSVVFLTLALGMGVTLMSCGDDNDEPVVPKNQNLESVYENETDTHFTFDIDMDKDSSSIYLYNVVFSIDDAESPAMNIRIDAPVTVDKSGKVYTYAGTNIVPYMLRGNTLVPMPSFIVTDLTCNVDTKRKYYEMFFRCHGGSYAANGDLK